MPGGSALVPLGGDQLGRSVWARLVFGARVSLLVGVATVAGAGTVGVLVGLISGYYRGLIDTVAMILADIQQAFPFLALAIAVVAVLGGGLINTVLVLSIAGWVLFARVTRAEVLAVRQRAYVEAARALGARDWRILLRHVVPNVTSPVIVIATFTFAYMIVAEASLSFLGLGVPPDVPTWGSMLNDGRGYLRQAWWLTTFPGLALMVTVLGTNLVGDWLRDRWDPRLKLG
jgi:peptide/nickel transport system permease protein